MTQQRKGSRYTAHVPYILESTQGGLAERLRSFCETLIEETLEKARNDPDQTVETSHYTITMFGGWEKGWCKKIAWEELKDFREIFWRSPDRIRFEVKLEYSGVSFK